MLKHTIVKSLDFTGRSTSSEFILYFAMSIFIQIALLLPLLILPHSYFSIAINFIYVIVMIPIPALFIRRLHDIDMSGWWYAPTILVYALNMMKQYQNGPIERPIFGISDKSILDNYWLSGLTLILLAFNFYIALKKGTPEVNHFGEPNTYDENSGWSFRFK